MIKMLFYKKKKTFNLKIKKQNKFNNKQIKINTILINIGKKEFNLMDKIRLKKLINSKRPERKEIKF